MILRGLMLAPAAPPLQLIRQLMGHAGDRASYRRNSRRGCFTALATLIRRRHGLRYATRTFLRYCPPIDCMQEVSQPAITDTFRQPLSSG